MNKSKQMKNSTRSGLTFGIGMTVFIIVYGLLQTEDFSISNSIKVIIVAIISGGIAGFTYGWIIGKFGITKKRD